MARRTKAHMAILDMREEEEEAFLLEARGLMLARGYAMVVAKECGLGVSGKKRK